MLHCSYVGLRSWLVALAFAPLPLVSATRVLIKLRQRNKGQCRTCGYNLTGNISGVCPECGTPNLNEAEVVA